MKKSYKSKKNMDTFGKKENQTQIKGTNTQE